MKREEREVYMSLKVSDIDIKIEKAEKEMAALNEKINKKKKEIAVLKKQRHAQELKERTKRNEEIVSELEEKLGVGISEDMINKFVEFQKQNFENTNLGDADYEKIYNFHKTNNYFITIVAAQKTNNVPYGVIEQKDGEFLYMKEKPSQTCIINTGLYVVSSGIKRYIKDQESVDFTELIERCKRNGKKIGVYVIREEAYMDMGQIEEMEQMKEKLGYKGE